MRIPAIAPVLGVVVDAVGRVGGVVKVSEVGINDNIGVGVGVVDVSVVIGVDVEGVMMSSLTAADAGETNISKCRRFY